MMHQFKTKLGEGGQIVIPAEFLQILGLEVGDLVILHLEDIEMHNFTLYGSIEIRPIMEL